MFKCMHISVLVFAGLQYLQSVFALSRFLCVSRFWQVYSAHDMHALLIVGVHVAQDRSCILLLISDRAFTCLTHTLRMQT